MSGAIVNYIIKAAIRDRLILSMVVLMALSVSLSIFFGSAATMEKAQYTAVYAAGSMRIINVLGLCLFVVFFIRRSFESRDIEYMLTRPIGRIKFLLSYAAGFSAIAILLALLTGACMALLSPDTIDTGLALWTFSLALENIIMVNAALFFSMIITSAATASFAVLGFYVLARMMSQILGIIDSGKHITTSSGHLYDGMEIAVQLVSALMPRLDLFAQTSWLIYGQTEQVGFAFIAAQGFIYAAILILAALIDLVMRKF